MPEAPPLLATCQSQDKEAKVPDATSPCTKNLEVITTHMSQLSSSCQVVLMTFQFRFTRPDGHTCTTKARALLDLASSALFITEHLAQRLCLPHHDHSMKISSIERARTKSPLQGMVDFKVTSLGSKGKTLDIKALVLPKITSVFPSHPVPFNRKWKHLMDISLADLDFGTPGNVDLLLGADVFSREVFHGQRFGPMEKPFPFKTCFGRVLVGVIHGCQQ